MPKPQVFKVSFFEDGSATALARLVARDATGAATGISGEGKWIKQADLSAITCAIYDLNSATPDTATSTPTVTISSAVIDTPVTDGVIWDEDLTGYNFLYDFPANSFPIGGRLYRVEFKVTTTGNAVLWLVYEGVALAVRTS